MVVLPVSNMVMMVCVAVNLVLIRRYTGGYPNGSNVPETLLNGSIYHISYWINKVSLNSPAGVRSLTAVKTNTSAAASTFNRFTLRII